MILLFVVGIVSVIVVENVVVQSYKNRALAQREIIVKNQCDILVDQLVNQNYMDEPHNEVIEGEFNMLTNIYGGRILVIDKNFRVIKDTYDLDYGRYLISKEVINCFKGEEIILPDEDNHYIELLLRIMDPDKKEIEGVLLVSISTMEIENSRRILERRGNMILGIVIVVILIFGFIASGFLVRPFQKITNSIEELMDGFLEGEISVRDYLETELITDAFNRMMGQVKTMDASRQEFVSNVSHELKTPLASMKVLADSLNMNPEATAEQYREFMNDISEEIDRETTIINDLLSLVKMDKQAEELNINKVDINALLELVVKRLKPIAKRQNVELILESFREVTAEVDETKLALVFTNIAENGIKYNKPEGGWVRISLNADRKYFFVTISDSGIGIPKEALDHIFERFYRVDKSHSREIGGTGIGLAITRSAIVMHKGAIRVTSEPDEGTVFSIRIPLVYTP